MKKWKFRENLQNRYPVWDFLHNKWNLLSSNGQHLLPNSYSELCMLERHVWMEHWNAYLNRERERKRERERERKREVKKEKMKQGNLFISHMHTPFWLQCMCYNIRAFRRLRFALPNAACIYCGQTLIIGSLVSERSLMASVHWMRKRLPRGKMWCGSQ